MKELLKKLAVMAAAVTILFAFSACDFLNGKGNQDDGSTTTQTDSTGTSTTNTTNTSGTTTGDNNTNGGGTTAGGETTGGGTATGGETSGGGESGGDQTVTTVAAFEELEGLGIDFIFYSNNTWENCYVSGTQSYTYMSGTYTGNPAQDGEVTLVTTKALPEDTEEESEEDSEPGELVDCEPVTMNMIVTNGILFIQDDEEEDDENSTPMYYIRKANEVVNYFKFFDDERGNFSLLKIIFYDNYTYKIIHDDEIDSFGNYDGNPCIDGEIALTIKLDDGRLIQNNTTPDTVSIVNGCFSGDTDESGSGIIPFAREIEVFKAASISEVIPTDSFFKFYADGTFLWTFSIMGVEKPSVYGTYTGNPCSTEANASVIITGTHEYCIIQTSDPSDDEEFSGEWSEIEEEDNTITLQISNNQFPFTTGYNDNDEPIIVYFVRQ